MRRTEALVTQRADRLAEHYIRAYGLHAVYVASAPTGPLTGVTRNVRAHARWLRHQHGHGTEILQHWWCASEADAAAVAKVLKGCGTAFTPPAELIAAAPSIAAGIEIELASGAWSPSARSRSRPSG
jgi:hypothetical protein